jgi:DNA gyrase/topoisomerase IV subunit B
MEKSSYKLFVNGFYSGIKYLEKIISKDELKEMIQDLIGEIICLQEILEKEKDEKERDKINETLWKDITCLTLFFGITEPDYESLTLSAVQNILENNFDIELCKKKYTDLIQKEMSVASDIIKKKR